MNKQLALYGGLALAAIFIGPWLIRKAGQAVGEAAVGAPSAIVGGAIDAAGDPSVNPLYPIGAWLGSTVYDVLHPAQ